MQHKKHHGHRKKHLKKNNNNNNKETIIAFAIEILEFERLVLLDTEDVVAYRSC